MGRVMTVITDVYSFSAPDESLRGSLGGSLNRPPYEVKTYTARLYTMRTMDAYNTKPEETSSLVHLNPSLDFQKNHQFRMQKMTNRSRECCYHLLHYLHGQSSVSS
jgi:hypothetical protein